MWSYFLVLVLLVVATTAPDPELTAMLDRAAVCIRLEVNRPPSHEPSRLDDWFLKAGRGSQPRSAPVPFFPEVHEELTKSWMAPFMARSARPFPPSSLPSTAGLPGGTRALPRWRERSRCTCAHKRVRHPASSLSPTTHLASSQESAVRGRNNSPRTSSQSHLGPREFGKDASERAAFCTIQRYSPSLHLHRYVNCAFGAACTTSGGVAYAAQPISLAHTHNSTRLGDLVRQTTSQV